MSVCINGIARARVRASNGNNSKLYADMLEVFDGNRDMALRSYAYVHSEQFKVIYGDFDKSSFKGKLDENHEPILEDVAESLDTFAINEELTPNLYNIKTNHAYFENFYAPLLPQHYHTFH